jgi:hypothetical protein
VDTEGLTLEPRPGRHAAAQDAVDVVTYQIES